MGKGGPRGSGWIPAYRHVFDPGHWLSPTKRSPASHLHAWLDLCQMATRQPRETPHSGTLKPGELVASLRTLGDRWCWSKDRAKRFMSALEVRTAIETVRETPSGTVYRVVNYDTYALLGDSERDTERDSKRDRGETATRQEQQVTSNKLTTPMGDSWPSRPPKKNGQYVYPEPFEKMWAEYPDRDGGNPKLGAYKKVRAQIEKGEDVEDLTAAARHYRQHLQKRDKVGTPYVQQASTFYGPSEPFRDFIEPPSQNGSGFRDPIPAPGGGYYVG